MSAAAGVEVTTTGPRQLEEAIARVRESARRWAGLSIREKIALARSMLQGMARVAERSVAAACAAKGIPPGSRLAGEEWLSGPYVTIRMLRQVVESLASLEKKGNTPVGPLGETIDGRLTVRVFPASLLDSLLFQGVRADVHLESGVDEAKLDASRAAFYKAPVHRGRVCAVLGAGNINSIPSADVVTKLFNEGTVCVLKMNPVNAYVGPFIEEAFGEAVEQGFLAVVYGGAEVGSALVQHPGVDEVHITGSEKTHDLIVWGPLRPERAERMARGQPVLAKPVSSELGNVSPVLWVPGPYSRTELQFQAENLAGAVTHNASFNCNAAKMLVTPKGWPERETLLGLVERCLSLVPARKAWYPGAQERYRRLTEGRPLLRRAGGGEGALPWTVIPGLDAADRSEPAFTTEPFCSILSEVPLASADPVEFLEKAVAFANERLWGTLNATLVVHPRTLADPTTGAAVERAIRALRYGTVAVNVWPGMAFAMGSTPWGAFPGAPLNDIQSGRGFVHNTRMLEHIEKCVLRHPITGFPKLPYFPSHRTADVLGHRLAMLEVNASWARLPGVVWAGVRG